MGYGGKVREQQRARELRAEAWTLQDIATELGVSKSSRVAVGPRRRVHAATRDRGHALHEPSSLHVRKLAEIERCHREGVEIDRPRCPSGSS